MEVRDRARRGEVRDQRPGGAEGAVGVAEWDDDDLSGAGREAQVDDAVAVDGAGQGGLRGVVAERGDGGGGDVDRPGVGAVVGGRGEQQATVGVARRGEAGGQGQGEAELAAVPLGLGVERRGRQGDVDRRVRGVGDGGGGAGACEAPGHGRARAGAVLLADAKGEGHGAVVAEEGFDGDGDGAVGGGRGEGHVGPGKRGERVVGVGWRGGEQDGGLAAGDAGGGELDPDAGGAVAAEGAGEARRAAELWGHAVEACSAAGVTEREQVGRGGGEDELVGERHGQRAAGERERERGRRRDDPGGRVEDELDAIRLGVEGGVARQRDPQTVAEAVAVGGRSALGDDAAVGAEDPDDVVADVCTAHMEVQGYPRAANAGSALGQCQSDNERESDTAQATRYHACAMHNRSPPARAGPTGSDRCHGDDGLCCGSVQASDLPPARASSAA